MPRRTDEPLQPRSCGAGPFSEETLAAGLRRRTAFDGQQTLEVTGRLEEQRAVITRRLLQQIAISPYVEGRLRDLDPISYRTLKTLAQDRAEARRIEGAHAEEFLQEYLGPLEYHAFAKAFAWETLWANAPRNPLIARMLELPQGARDQLLLFGWHRQSGLLGCMRAWPEDKNHRLDCPGHCLERLGVPRAYVRVQVPEGPLSPRLDAFNLWPVHKRNTLT